MKHILLISFVIIFNSSAVIHAEVPTSSHTVGGYMSMTGKLSSFYFDNIGFLDIRTAATIDEVWGIGIGFSGLYYDKKLSVLVADGTYHLNAGYIGLYVERFFLLSDDISLSVSLLSGVGAAEYLYDKEYRKNKTWTQEVIDRTTFSVVEPGVEVSYRIGPEVSLGMMGSYRTTSPIDMINTCESLFDEFNYGVTIKWQFF